MQYHFSKLLLIIYFLIISGCIKQSNPLHFNNLIITEKVDGNNRDMVIVDTTLFVVSEDDGLLIYGLDLDLKDSTIKFNSLFSDSLYFINYDLNLIGVLFSQTLREVFILDKFYSIQSAIVDSLYKKTDFNKVGSFLDNEHPSRFSINDDNSNIELFSLIRYQSGQEGIPSDIVSIYETDIIRVDGLDESIDDNKLIIDSLIYDVTDIHYQSNNLFISNTSNLKSEFRMYSRSTEFSAEEYETIDVPYKPKCIYSNDEFLFVGMLDRGGVKIYRISNMQEVLWIAKGFSIREIYWDKESNLLLLSCGYQGVVIIELDDGNTINSWLISSSYAYSSRYYMGNVIVSTKNGIETIKFK